MTQDEIIRMAREAGFVIYDNERRSVEGEEKNLERFFNLAFAAGAAHEREACAKNADYYAKNSITASNIAKAIRARGEK